MQKPKLHFQRFEFKYFLPKNTADKLIPALLNHMEWDPYVLTTGRDHYQVNSLYFDNENFDCFWDKEAGVSDRKKFRFRYYGHTVSDDQRVFLEIKRKNNALVIKDRILLPANDAANNILDAKLLELYKQDPDNDFIHELIWFKKRNCLRPKLFVTYKRKALIDRRDKRFRVTFDYDIRAQLADRLTGRFDKLRAIYPTGVVLEVKYNNVLPKWFHEVIQKYQLQRITFSKYCNGLRKVKPVLDDNNYII